VFVLFQVASEQHMANNNGEQDDKDGCGAKCASRAWADHACALCDFWGTRTRKEITYNMWY
jgi:hypothetical protein